MSKETTASATQPEPSVQTRSDEQRIAQELAGLDRHTDPFVAAVHATRMPMIITNPRIEDNPVVFANDSFCRLTGYDEKEILDFCSWYGLDPDQVVTAPLPSHHSDDSKQPLRAHTRTIFQLLQQNVDLFGRPPKAFYAALAEYATSREERMTLLFIASGEGVSLLRKMAEDETVTYADVLRRFSSAHPPVQHLLEMVGEIKERHYSIASANAVVGDRVDLLVVTVNWSAPDGEPACLGVNPCAIKTH